MQAPNRGLTKRNGEVFLLHILSDRMSVIVNSNTITLTHRFLEDCRFDLFSVLYSRQRGNLRVCSSATVNHHWRFST